MLLYTLTIFRWIPFKLYCYSLQYTAHNPYVSSLKLGVGMRAWVCIYFTMSVESRHKWLFKWAVYQHHNTISGNAFHFMFRTQLSMHYGFVQRRFFICFASFHSHNTWTTAHAMWKALNFLCQRDACEF